ncbi:hypothetical protein ACFFX0_08985 [Citricoccus parietis]|uniref:Uncharacterized protein n=1 Tax=Citricoccus parietis TaxID=592307 RepID=A0ABV5FYL5_9MICC
MPRGNSGACSPRSGATPLGRSGAFRAPARRWRAAARAGRCGRSRIGSLRRPAPGRQGGGRPGRHAGPRPGKARSRRPRTGPRR